MLNVSERNVCLISCKCLASMKKSNSGKKLPIPKDIAQYVQMLDIWEPIQIPELAKYRAKLFDRSQDSKN